MIQDLLASQREDEWNSILLGKENKTTLNVVLKDRLMTDAALGGPRPVKTEHNYSMLASSSPASPAIPENNQHTPNLISSSVQNQIIHTKQGNEAKTIGLQTRIDGKFNFFFLLKNSPIFSNKAFYFSNKLFNFEFFFHDFSTLNLLFF